MQFPSSPRAGANSSEPSFPQVTVSGEPGTRRFNFQAASDQRTIQEAATQPFCQTGSPLFDGLFALALEEVRENSVSHIHARDFNNGEPLAIEAFETGALWPYVWTRDISYAADLALASLNPQRCARSLIFKTSATRKDVSGPAGTQILQDTGSGGSYPVSTDRVIWALAAARIAHHLPPPDRDAWVSSTLPILQNTIEQDRRLIFNASTGLYRGEQSFLDWREQTYPIYTRANVLPIATSQSLSTNVAHLIILQTAAAWSKESGQADTARRYEDWSNQLKQQINTHLFDESAGLYAGYLFGEAPNAIRIHRYELLGNCLAILAGVADPARAGRILAAYPTGPHGPPVVWPQESSVPIYHNHAMWPFVTAYWLKAARAVGNESAIAAAIHSLARGAALHLSNMENLDYATGAKKAEVHGIAGPVVNSRRQLWSVAAYVCMVQDAVFGLETTDHAIRFRPSLPAQTRSTYFPNATALHLNNLHYRSKRIDLTIHLPAASQALAIGTVTLNGAAINGDFVPFENLRAENDWHIQMVPASDAAPAALRIDADMENRRAVFGPVVPQWATPAFTVHGNQLQLHFASPGESNVLYNIHRDGQQVARAVNSNSWIDPHSSDHATNVRAYTIESFYPDTGNHSHLSETRRHFPVAPREIRVNAASTLASPPLQFLLPIEAPGRYAVRLLYSNGAGTMQTGITCAVKKLELRDNQNQILAAAHLALPHTGGEQFVHPSSALAVRIDAPGQYVLQVLHDGDCRNMSYFEHNQAYTAHEGGGAEPFNSVHIQSIRLEWLGS